MSTSPSIAVHEKEVHHGFPSFSKYIVSAVDPQTAVSASISISSTSSGQSLVIPVTLIHVADSMQGQISRLLCIRLPRHVASSVFYV